MKNSRILCLSLTLLIALSSYAQKKETHIELQVQEGKEQSKALKRKVAIARFSNETQYGKGIFYDKENDPMAKQALWCSFSFGILSACACFI